MSTIFPTADCDANAIDFVARNVPEFAGTTATKGRFGFHLMGNVLVPYRFVDIVEHELTGDRLNCFKVTELSELFSDTFLTSLSPLEFKVLGGCVLLLIEKGFVPFSLLEEKGAV